MKALHSPAKGFHDSAAIRGTTDGQKFRLLMESQQDFEGSGPSISFQGTSSLSQA
jgi:hypothetical protein